jgi:MFS family permease
MTCQNNDALEKPWPNLPYAILVLLLLTAAFSMSFVSRAVLNLLVEDVKADLHISDFQISLLTGVSFSIFYVIVGLPLARLMDSSNRRNIIAASVVMWSLMTALCGAVRSFPGLFLARVGLGCGEAGLTPGAASMLADYFPKRHLAAAMGVYSMGIYIGSGLALIVGGQLLLVLSHIGPITVPWLGLVKPWQMVFFAVGLPSIVLAPLMLLIREPPRRKAATATTLDSKTSIPLREVFAFMTGHWSVYAGVLVGFSLMILVGSGVSAWIPAFFIRKFGWTATEVGNWYGSSYLIFGALGTVCGGFFAAFLRKRGIQSGNLVASLLAFVLLVPVTIVFPLVNDGVTALAFTALMNFLAGFPFGGGIATLQEITPSAMRAQVAALYGLCINLLGGALGPSVIGLLTDRVFNDPAKLPYSIAITAAVFSSLAAFFLWLGLSGYRKLIKTRVQQAVGG